MRAGVAQHAHARRRARTAARSRSGCAAGRRGRSGRRSPRSIADSGSTESFRPRASGATLAAMAADRHPPASASSPRCARSGAAAPFVASLIGRLPMGAVGLVFILRTQRDHRLVRRRRPRDGRLRALARRDRAGHGPADRPQGPDARAARHRRRLRRGADRLRGAARRRERRRDRRARGAHAARRSRRSARRCARCGTRPRRPGDAPRAVHRRVGGARGDLHQRPGADRGGDRRARLDPRGGAARAALFGLLGTADVRRHAPPRARGARHPTAWAGSRARSPPPACGRCWRR